MRFDAATFARGWLAVRHASATKDDVAALSRTIAIEEYVRGVRLVATDRYIMLTAWVPALGTDEPEPDLAAAPDRTVVVQDTDSRAKGMLSYLLTLYTRKAKENPDAPEGLIEVRLDFDVKLPPDENEQAAFEGMEPVYAVLDTEDVERVYVPIVQADYPEWRRARHGFHAEETKRLNLDPDRLNRISGAAKFCEPPMAVEFGGADKVIAVDFPESDPHVTGLMMPVRWLLPGETAAEEECPTCQNGEFCLRHASGVYTSADLDKPLDRAGWEWDYTDEAAYPGDDVADRPHGFVTEDTDEDDPDVSCLRCGRRRAEGGYVHADDAIKCPMCKHIEPVSMDDADASQSAILRHMRTHVGVDTNDDALTVLARARLGSSLRPGETMTIHVPATGHRVTIDHTGDPVTDDPDAPVTDVGDPGGDTSAGQGSFEPGLLRQCIELVVARQSGSTKMLQREARIGFIKAQTIMEHLETLGVVGPVGDRKPREVLFPADDVESALALIEQ